MIERLGSEYISGVSAFKEEGSFFGMCVAVFFIFSSWAGWNQQSLLHSMGVLL